MFIVTTRQMQAAEKAADASGLSYEQMMENAGCVIAQAVHAQCDTTQARVLVLVGPGNNGGDGLVVARYLAQTSAKVTVYVWKRTLTIDKNWLLLDTLPVEKILGHQDPDLVKLVQLVTTSDIIIDALLGTGVSRPITDSLAKLLERTQAIVKTRRSHLTIAESLVDPARPRAHPEPGPQIFAVDVPSGLNSDTGAVDPYTLPVNMTITLAAVKRGHVLLPGANIIGKLIVGDIGLTSDCYPNDVTLQMVTAATVAQILPERPPAAHKGTFGTALLAVGSVNYTGAAMLAGQSAARVGTGLVTLAVPDVIYPILASGLPEATYQPLPQQLGVVMEDSVPLLREKFSGARALLIGSGLGHTASTSAFLVKLLGDQESLPPLVLDADALNILATQPDWWQLLPPHAILTPHPGEMARLMNSTIAQVQANRLDIAVTMAAQWQQVVVLKGANTVVAAPNGQAMVLPFANPALAKAGSGDVLAGAIVGLRAQGLSPFYAAVAGAYLHGLAGELARDQLGATSVIAGDLIKLLPMAIRQVRME